MTKKKYRNIRSYEFSMNEYYPERANTDSQDFHVNDLSVLMVPMAVLYYSAKALKLLSVVAMKSTMLGSRLEDEYVVVGVGEREENDYQFELDF